MRPRIIMVQFPFFQNFELFFVNVVLNPFLRFFRPSNSSEQAIPLLANTIITVTFAIYWKCAFFAIAYFFKQLCALLFQIRFLALDLRSKHSNNFMSYCFQYGQTTTLLVLIQCEHRESNTHKVVLYAFINACYRYLNIELFLE